MPGLKQASLFSFGRLWESAEMAPLPLHLFNCMLN